MHLKSLTVRSGCLRNAASQVAYFFMSQVCVCLRRRQCRLVRVGSFLWGIPRSQAASGQVGPACCHSSAGIWRRRAPSPPPAEAEWIWDSEEVVNLHLGDMSLE